MRKEFVMSDAQFQTMLEALRPIPIMIVGGRMPPSPQEVINAAWRNLGAEMGFDPETVQPTEKGAHIFTAEEKT